MLRYCIITLQKHFQRDGPRVRPDAYALSPNLRWEADNQKDLTTKRTQNDVKKFVISGFNR